MSCWESNVACQNKACGGVLSLSESESSIRTYSNDTNKNGRPSS